MIHLINTFLIFLFLVSFNAYALTGTITTDHWNTLIDSPLRSNKAASEHVMVRDLELSYAIARIENDYGDTVSVMSKLKALLKFGRNMNVGSGVAGYTIWYTGQDEDNETYPAANTNSIDTISSSSSSDAGIMVKIEGHTESGGNKTFVVQTATIGGRIKTTIDTPLNRMTRIYNIDSTDLTGEIYGYEDTAISSGKPSDTTKIHITVPAGKNQSEKASTSLSSQDYWIVTSFRCSLLEKANSFADVALQIRLSGSVFRQAEDVSCSSSHNGVFHFKPYLIVPKNADVRLVGISDSTSRDVSGSIQGYLAIVE